MCPRNAEIVRCEQCPDIVKLQLTLRRSHSPGLASWIWDRPYRVAEVIKVALERALQRGELDVLEKEITHGQTRP